MQNEVGKRTDLIDNILKTENLDLTQTIDEVNQSTKVETPSMLRPIRFTQRQPKLETVGSMDEGSQKAASAVFQTIVMNEEQSLAAKARSVEEEILGRRTSLTTLEDEKVMGRESERDLIYKTKILTESPSIQQIRKDSISLTQGMSAPRKSVVAPV